MVGVGGAGGGSGRGQAPWAHDLAYICAGVMVVAVRGDQSIEEPNDSLGTEVLIKINPYPVCRRQGLGLPIRLEAQRHHARDTVWRWIIGL